MNILAELRSIRAEVVTLETFKEGQSPDKNVDERPSSSQVSYFFPASRRIDNVMQEVETLYHKLITAQEKAIHHDC